MRFIDEAKIKISGGHGGPGCVSFRREACEPRGGPNGGDGGQGGSVRFIASSRLVTLQDFRFKRVYRAENGQHGSGSNKSGRDGQDIELEIPLGTLIKDSEGQVLVDFTFEGQIWEACQGGRGGKGNAHFVTSTHQAPKYAQPGEEGTQLEIFLELKLLADAAIVGLPNAGKSTLISRMSAAKPKIADYPFTTLTPHLGVVAVGEHQSFVLADIPGLIEGAHKGIGLGHKFLKHIERTRVMIHLIDASILLPETQKKSQDESDDGPDNESGALDTELKSEVEAELIQNQGLPQEEGILDPSTVNLEPLMQAYEAIRGELRRFSEQLTIKHEMIALNKVDCLPWDEKQLAVVQKRIHSLITGHRDSSSGQSPDIQEPYMVSAVSGDGVSDLGYAVFNQICRHQRHSLPGSSESAPSKEVLLPDDKRIRV